MFSHLITLGTPHLGSPLAAIQRIIGMTALVTDPSFFDAVTWNVSTQGFRDLDPNSQYIRRLLTYSKSTVPYYTIACINGGANLY